MRILLLCLLCLLTVTILGCATPKNSFIAPFITKDTKQCLAQCAVRFDQCRGLCSNNCAVCSFNALTSSMKQYAKYVHEEQVRGGYITRGLKSYRDPLQCRKVTCNCDADVMTCEQSCTGIIHKEVREVPYCA